MAQHQDILIIGAGTAGIMVAAKLKKSNTSLDITIIDPADTHFYQPAWTLVGAGAYDFKKNGQAHVELNPERCQMDQRWRYWF